MSKKYVPSGYQILEIDVSDKTSGNSYAPSTKDEEILLESLKKIENNEKVKPILLVINDGGDLSSGFVNIDYSISQINLNIGACQTLFTYSFMYDDEEKFTYSFSEL
jgi:hypothetical protein